MNNYQYRHWVPKAPIKKDFPFEYTLAKMTDAELSMNEEDFSNKIEEIEVEATIKMDKLREIIRNRLVSIFNYNNYLNKYSPNYKNFDDYYFKIVRYNLVPGTRKPTKEYDDPWYLKATNFKSEYTFNLVPSIEELKKLFEDNPKVIAFDTETTGLNPDEDDIVSMSISFKEKEGYVIPINHAEEFSRYNLGLEAIKIVYEALTKADIVFMFNARFDMRMLEYTKSDVFFDTSKIKYNDTQLNMHFADPEIRQYSLEFGEKHFLGYVRPDLKSTLSAAAIKDFNFKYINPEVGLFYAAQDAISTLELGLNTYQYYKEFGISGEIDQKLVFVLMRYENFATRVDYNFAKEQLTHIQSRLKELNTQLQKAIGDVNLNSNIQRANLLTSFGLDTGEVTKSGAMATGMPAILAMLERLKEEGEEYPEWLELLDERAKLEKLDNTFFGRIVEQAKDTGRLRINYRLGVTATGRLSSGKFTGVD